MAENVKVVDKGWNKIKSQLKGLTKGGGRVAAVGIQGAEAQADHDGITNAELGAIHEYGTQDGLVPERSHFRSTMAEYESQLDKGLVAVAQDVFSGKDPEPKLRMLGEEYRGLVLRKIKAGIEPGLSETTLAMGRTDPPLIATGQYWNAISSEIASWNEKQEG